MNENEIFMSYRREDIESDDDGRLFVEAVEQCTGLKVFWDKRDLYSGDFPIKIRSAVRDCYAFMPVVTTHYILFGTQGERRYDNDYCLTEYAAAIMDGKRIIPIFIKTDGNTETVTAEQAQEAAERVLNLSYGDEDIEILKKYLFHQNGICIGSISKDRFEEKKEEFARLVFNTFCDVKYKLPFFKEYLLKRSNDLNPLHIFGDFDDSGLTLEKNYVPISFLRHLTLAEQKEKEERKESIAPTEAREDTILSALEKERLAVIVGDAGQGKTSFVKHLFIRLTDEASQYGLSKDLFFPIYVECKGVKGDSLSCENDFFQALAESAHLDPAALKNILRFGKPLLIFDAMDEVSPTQMDKLITAIYSYIYNNPDYPKTHILFTSRPGQKLVAGRGDMTLNRKDDTVVRRYSVRELDETQQDDYIAKLSAVKMVDDDTRSAFWAAVKDKEKNITEYRSVSRNPFMLFTIFSTYTQWQELPANRFDAVSRIIHDVISRDLQREDYYRQIGPENIKVVFGAVSFKIYIQRDKGKAAHFNLDDVCELTQNIYCLNYSDERISTFRKFFSTSRLLDENGFRHEFLAATYAAYYLLFLMKKKDEPLKTDSLSKLIGKDTDYWKSVTEALLCLLDRKSEDSKPYIEPLLAEMQKTEQPDYDTLCSAVTQFTNHQARAAEILLSGMLERGCEGVMSGERDGYGFICQKGVNPYEELFYFPAVYPDLQQYLPNLKTEAKNDAEQYLCSELIREVCALFSDEYYQKLQNVYNGRSSSAYPDIVKKLADAADRRGESLHGYVRIRDGETKIGDMAFSDCTGLTNITIPNSVTEIADWAFSGCTGMTNITIPNSVTEIADWAFFGCTGLTNITIPNSVTEIGSDAFSGCTGLTNITISNSVTEIADWAFSGCTGLTSINVCDNNLYYSSIDGVLFNKEQIAIISYPAGKTGAYTVPDSVIEIEFDAFRGCTGLTSITIPDSVTVIEKIAFYGCTGLTSINVDENNTFYSSIDGVLFNKDKTAVILYPAGRNGAYTIPANVTEIGRIAFSYCTGLTSITIPASVKKIGGMAFWCCTNLISINVNDNNLCYSSVDGVLFNKEKTSIIFYPSGQKGAYIIPDSVTEIGEEAFSGCTGLTSVTIPNSVTEIADCAFSGCTGLTSITIPDSVTSIGWSAFSGCTWLTSVTIPNSVTEIGKWSFNGCTGLTSITIPDSVTEIGEEAFSGCTGLTSVTIPNSVTEIADCAFSGCTGLTKVNIPASVKAISGYAFHGCTGLTSVTIPNSVTDIGDWAFSDCTGLTSVTIPDSVTEIGEWSFNGCPNLTIHGKKGSYAEAYANKKNIPFIPE